MSVCECMSLYKTLHRVVAGACFGAQYKSVLEITQTHIHIHTYSVKTREACFLFGTCVRVYVLSPGWSELVGHDVCARWRLTIRSGAARPPAAQICRLPNRFDTRTTVGSGDGEEHGAG